MGGSVTAWNKESRSPTTAFFSSLITRKGWAVPGNSAKERKLYVDKVCTSKANYGKGRKYLA